MSRRRVLIVDHATGASAIRAFLAEAGCDALTISRLSASFAETSNDEADLVILATRHTPAAAPIILLNDQGIEPAAGDISSDVIQILSPDALPDEVQKALRGVQQPPAQTAAREWTRKRVTDDVTACISNFPARIIDVSYGGLRFELERVPGRWLPLSFDVELPTSQLSIGVDIVWKNRSGESRWQCGAAVWDSGPNWRAIVDAIS